MNWKKVFQTLIHLINKFRIEKFHLLVSTYRNPQSRSHSTLVWQQLSYST